MLSFKGMMFRVLGVKRFVRIFGRPCTSKNCTKGEACAFGDPAECPYQNVRKVKAAEKCPYLKKGCISPFPCMREGRCTQVHGSKYCGAESDKGCVKCEYFNEGYCAANDCGYYAYDDFEQEHNLYD